MQTSLQLERRERLAAAMGKEPLAGFLVYGNAWQCDYFRFVAGVQLLEGEGIAIMRADGRVSVLLDSMFDVERIEAGGSQADLHYCPSLLASAQQILTTELSSPVGAAPFRLLPQRLVHDNRERLIDRTSWFDQLLMNKSALELSAVRRAAELADDGYEVFRQAVRVGRFDYEVVAEVESFYRKAGVEDNFMIIGLGGSEIRGMSPPTGKQIKAGDLVTTELTPSVDGYYAQICRTLVVGSATTEQQDAFGIYLDAMERGIAATRPGITAADIAFAQNEVFRRHDLGIYVTSEYTRVRGHGLGLFPDSKPHVLEDVSTPIREGMTLIVHPNTYHPAVGYIVLGDSVEVTASGCNILNKIPRRLFSVPA